MLDDGNWSITVTAITSDDNLESYPSNEVVLTLSGIPVFTGTPMPPATQQSFDYVWIVLVIAVAAVAVVYLISIRGKRKNVRL
jgi:hypothetical protein